MASVDVKDYSKDVKAAYEQARQRSLEIIGMTAEGYAKKICPVGTPESTGIAGYVGGRSRDSITHAVEGKAVYIGSNVSYFPHFEFGTIHMKARPTLRPAATEHSNTYKQIIQSEFAKIPK